LIEGLRDLVVDIEFEGIWSKGIDHESSSFFEE